MSKPDSLDIAIGKIALFFGTRAGALNINIVLNTFGFSNVPLYTKIDKVSFALNQLRTNPLAFSEFLTVLISLHPLTTEDIDALNSNLKPAGYLIKEGRVVPTTLEGIRELTEKIPFINEEAQRMAEAYTILYLLENSLRGFIKEKLEEKDRSKWWENFVSKKIRENCEMKTKKELESPWHEVRKSHLLWYTDFDELQSIIQTNWEVFRTYFHNQHTVIGRLSELEIPRNTIAHDRLLEKSELERLRLFSQDIFKCIIQQ
jgi:hypothetical protein